MFVLAVESDRDHSQLIERVLRDAGHTVISAASASEAEHIFAAVHAELDLLLVAAELQDSDGPKLARRITAVRPDLHVVFISRSSRAASALRTHLLRGTFDAEAPVRVQRLRREYDRAKAEARRLMDIRLDVGVSSDGLRAQRQAVEAQRKALQVYRSALEQFAASIAGSTRKIR